MSDSGSRLRTTSLGVCAEPRYRGTHPEPKCWDVQSVYFRACATACLLAGTLGHPRAQAPLVPGRLPTLPLTQLDDRTLSADLDNRAFTLTFAQPVAIPDLLLLLVRGTSLSVVPDSGVSGTFIGELKNV